MDSFKLDVMHLFGACVFLANQLLIVLVHQVELDGSGDLNYDIHVHLQLVSPIRLDGEVRPEIGPLSLHSAERCAVIFGSVD